LRDALSIGNRCIVFDVGGTITLQSVLVMRGGNITIDGFTAPAPGITIRNYKLLFDGRKGATNVIARGLRIRDTNLTVGENNNDGISIEYTSDVVVDHVSISGFGDGAIDVITARDVTIQWSIVGQGNPAHNDTLLVKYDSARVTVHHNLFVNTWDRNPMCGASDTATANPPELVCDVRNNLVWNYGQWATTVRQ
jgi:pectate lyase